MLALYACLVLVNFIPTSIYDSWSGETAIGLLWVATRNGWNAVTDRHVVIHEFLYSNARTSALYSESHTSYRGLNLVHLNAKHVQEQKQAFFLYSCFRASQFEFEEIQRNWSRLRKLAPQIVRSVPEAATTVLCTPDDRSDGRPKHVE